MLISIKRLYMANKKRYYHKNRAQKPDNAENSAIQQQTALYSSEQLSQSLQSLGISEATSQLLEKNRILTAADLVRRTEKDMYKVQGLNKKILFEVKDALKKGGMSLRPEQKPQAPQDKQRQDGKAEKSVDAQKDQPQKKQKVDKNAKQDDLTGDRRTSKFGLADKAQKPQNKAQNVRPQSQKGQNQKPAQAQKGAPQKPQKPEKLTEPLPFGEWRKVLKGGKWGYSDGFKIVIPTMYDEIFAFKDGLASVEIDEKCGYIDKDNNVVIPLDYDTAMSFSEGLAMVVKGDKCGYINKNNEVVIPFEYDAGTPFEDGEAKIKKDGKWGTINVEGKIVWI